MFLLSCRPSHTFINLSLYLIADKHSDINLTSSAPVAAENDSSIETTTKKTDTKEAAADSKEPDTDTKGAYFAEQEDDTKETHTDTKVVDKNVKADSSTKMEGDFDAKKNESIQQPDNTIDEHVKKADFYTEVEGSDSKGTDADTQKVEDKEKVDGDTGAVKPGPDKGDKTKQPNGTERLDNSEDDERNPRSNLKFGGDNAKPGILLPSTPKPEKTEMDANTDLNNTNDDEKAIKDLILAGIILFSFRSKLKNIYYNIYSRAM